MKKLIKIFQDILDHGHDHGDRTGKGRRSIFSVSERFDLREGFPIPTTRFIGFKSVMAETLWFIQGSSNVKELQKLGCSFWNPWASTEADVQKVVEILIERDIIHEDARSAMFTQLVNKAHNSAGLDDIGPMYGAMWRYWPRITAVNPLEIKRKVEEIPRSEVENLTQIWDSLNDPEKETGCSDLESFILRNYYSTVDQLNELVQNLKTDPYSSRHVVSAFNPEFLPIKGYSPSQNVILGKGSLMPCHFAFQCFVLPPEHAGGKPRLSLKWHQRSVDTALGLPHNIPSYALLTHMLAHVTGMEAHEVIFDGGDTHIYLPHISQVKEQIQREPFPLPTLWLNPEVTDLFEFKPEDIRLDNYQHHPKMAYEAYV